MPRQKQYELVEALDPELTHFEFFLGRPPLRRWDATDEARLLAALAVRSPCMMGWPGRSLLDYDYQPVDITPIHQELLAQATGTTPVAQLIAQVPGATVADIRDLYQRQLLWLQPW